MKECLLPPTGDNDNDDDEAVRGDVALDAFKPVFEVSEDGSKVVTCYKVEIPNPLQFDYVVSLLSAGLTFCQISQVVRENRNQLGCVSKTGCLSDGKALCFSCIVYAVGLQILSNLMKASWAFPVATDGSTNDFGNSHLDVQVRFPGIEIDDKLLSFHLLAIPLFNKLHSGASLFNFFATVFNAFCVDWKVKVVGSSTDGASELSPIGRKRVLAALAVLYLASMNGLGKVIAGRQAVGLNCLLCRLACPWS